MALQYYSSSGNSSSATIIIIGDGTSLSINIDLEVPSLNFSLKANKPLTAIFTGQSGPSFTGVLNGDRTSITLTFSSPPASGSSAVISMQLYFGGQ